MGGHRPGQQRGQAQGTSMQGIETSPARKRRRAAARRRQEARWASLAGPVTVTRTGDAAVPEEPEQVVGNDGLW
jgi:hypothetical protein